MSDGRPYSVFLSYSRRDADRQRVEELWNLIEDRNFRTFYDRSDLVTGEGPLGRQITDALAEARLMLVCVGRQGLGPYQRMEIAHALGIENGEGGRGLTIRILMLGDVTYPELPSIPGLQPRDDDDERMRAFLKSLTDGSLESDEELAFAFPPRDGAATTNDIVGWLAQNASVPRDEPPLDAEADAEATMLAEQIAQSGITLFVGSVWPDRSQDRVFSASRYARDLLKRCGISEGAALSLEQAASLFGLFADNSDERTRRRIEIRTEIKESVALYAPVDYGRICEVIARLKLQFDKGQRARRPIVIVTTNIDSLFERELIDKGVSFITLTPGEDDEYRQTHFWVSEDIEDGAARLSLDSQPTEGRNGSGVPAGYPKRFPPDRSTVSTEIYDPKKDLMATPTGARKVSVDRYMAYKQKLENVVHDRRIWRFSEIDRIVEEHYKSSVNVTYGDAKDATQKSAAAVQEICIRDGIPVVVKVLGCVHDQGERAGIDVEAMYQMFDNAVERFPPGQIRARMGMTGVLFCGFSIADLSYLYAFSRLFGKNLKHNARTRRIFLTAWSTGDGNKLDHFDEVDSVIATRQHTQLDMLRNVTVVTRPGVRRFVETLASRLAPAD